jgi:hypothetical protein
MPTAEFKQANRRKRRYPIDLDGQTEKNLVAYETAARAATANHRPTASAPLLAVGLSMFALPQVTLAEVVCTPVKASLQGTGHLKFDLNNDGIQDVSVNGYSTFIIGSDDNFFRSDYLGAHGLVAGNGIVAFGREFAFALRNGQEFGPSGDFPNAGFMARHFSNLYSSSTRGQWKNVKSARFLGVKFLISEETHYGWIRFTSSVTSRLSGVEATVDGYAYETVADKSVVAGMCDEEAMPAKTVMEAAPGSLGRLAVGMAGR